MKLSNTGEQKPYPEMKDSGFEWLGEVPLHWEVHRTKSLLSRNDSGVWGSDFDDDGVIVLRSTEQTVNGEWNISAPAKRRLTASEYKACRLKEGDLLVTKSSGSALHIGKTSIVTRDVADLDCCFSNFMQRLSTKDNTIPRFLWYVLNGELGRTQLNYYSDTTTGLANLNGEIIGSVTLASPPIIEQTTIVRFLDHADQRIRRYIRAKQKLVALLEEQKQAIIHQAVTGQIDVRTGQPYPSYKDSGVEWLGEVPSHWEVRRARYIFREIDRRSPDGSEQHLSMSQSLGLVPSHLVKNRTLVSENYAGGKLCRSGDLVLNRLKAHLGVFARAQQSGVISTDYTVLRPNREAKTEYFEQVLRSPSCRGELRTRAKGIVEGFWRLYTDDLYDIYLPLPTVDEQESIIRWVKSISMQAERNAALGDREVALLHEYRNRLIADVVTGKLDVREAAAALPEVNALASKDDLSDSSGQE